MPAVLPPPTELLELLPDAVCVVDPDGVLLYANAAFQRLLGYPHVEVLGRRMFELVHADDHDATSRQAARLMDGTGERHFRNRYMHREGHAVDLLWSAKWIPEYGVRVAVAREVGELRRVEEELANHANNDALTGVVNRRRVRKLLELALSEAALNDTAVALLFVDLDGFKAINDLHGHEAGDRVLVEVARRLQAGLRQCDVIGRIGGDEFVAVLPGCDADAARLIVDALNLQLQQPFEVGSGALLVGASVGAAAYPADAQGADALLARADAAMYQVKRTRAGQST